MKKLVKMLGAFILAACLFSACGEQGNGQQPAASPLPTATPAPTPEPGPSQADREAAAAVEQLYTYLENLNYESDRLVAYVRSRYAALSEDALTLIEEGPLLDAEQRLSEIKRVNHPENYPSPAFTQEEIDRLDAFCSQWKYMGVWLQDMETGSVYTHSPYQGYYCASTLKAPYALWLCQRADSGEIDLEAQITNPANKRTKSGWLKDYRTEDLIPAWTCLDAMVANSDNCATDILTAQWPGSAETGFQDFLRYQLGYDSPEGCEMTNKGITGWTNAADGAKVMNALYDYFRGNNDHSNPLKAVFSHATHSMLYIPEGVQAAKKYGSWDNAFHDMCIVYGEKPYILCCYTGWGDTKTDFPAQAVERMQQLGKLAWEVTQN